MSNELKIIKTVEKIRSYCNNKFDCKKCFLNLNKNGAYGDKYVCFFKNNPNSPEHWNTDSLKENI